MQFAVECRRFLYGADLRTAHVLSTEGLVREQMGEHQKALSNHQDALVLLEEMVGNSSSSGAKSLDADADAALEELNAKIMEVHHEALPHRCSSTLTLTHP